MASHLIVLFDTSGSMAEAFKSNLSTAKDAEYVAEHQIKIHEAQERLIAALSKSQFDTITIIPFHATVETEFTASRQTQKRRIDTFIRKQKAGGGTNLGAALSVAINSPYANTFANYAAFLKSEGGRMPPRADKRWPRREIKSGAGGSGKDLSTSCR